jgi:AcrR family transcriptional regulator
LKARNTARREILSAARNLAQREGAARLSLRGVASEAGFAPAALYVYFQNKDELMLTLAADDLGKIAREMQAVSRQKDETAGAQLALSAALALLSNAETLAAATTAMNSRAKCQAARLFNGRLIAALSALSAATETPAGSREGQADVLLLAATLIGLAALVRSRCLEILGFAPDEMLARLSQLSGRT